MELEMESWTGLPRCFSTSSSSRPTFDPARFMTMWSFSSGYAIRCMVVKLMLRFFTLGRSRLATRTTWSAQSRATRMRSSKNGGVSTMT